MSFQGDTKYNEWHFLLVPPNIPFLYLYPLKHIIMTDDSTSNERQHWLPLVLDPFILNSYIAKMGFDTSLANAWTKLETKLHKPVPRPLDGLGRKARISNWRQMNETMGPLWDATDFCMLGGGSVLQGRNGEHTG
jgi:hypothetical protein